MIFFLEINPISNKNSVGWKKRLEKCIASAPVSFRMLFQVRKGKRLPSTNSASILNFVNKASLSIPALLRPYFVDMITDVLCPEAPIALLSQYKVLAGPPAWDG